MPSPVTVVSLPSKSRGDFANNAMMVMLSNGKLCGWGDNTTGCLANAISAATASRPQYPLFDPNTTLPPTGATIADWSFVNANLYVVYSNGWVYSAGKNAYGQLGHGDTVARPYLKRIEYFVTGSKTITKVWASGAALTTDGGGCVYFQANDYSMYACGENTRGNLGNASTPTSNVSTPAPCAGLGTSPYVVQVHTSVVNNGFSTYMLMSDGTLKVAGYNAQGQLSNNTVTDITGSFATALINTSPVTPLSNIQQISVGGGYNASAGGGGASALALDTSGNVWSVGYNAQGQLGLGNTTTPQKLFTKITTLSSITKIGIGGSNYGYSYALSSSGTFYTWGYNGQNNLFQNNTTTPKSSPVISTFLPGAVSKVYFPRGDVLLSNSQIFILTASGKLAYAGVDNGQTPIDNSINPGAYSYIATPRQFLDGTENISDIFVHGSGTNQRLFILSDLGNLYSSGKNLDSICTGGVASDTAAANVSWFKISFAEIQ